MFLLKEMGQSPTEDEVKALINSVDDGDGQLQLREFLVRV